MNKQFYFHILLLFLNVSIFTFYFSSWKHLTLIHTYCIDFQRHWTCCKIWCMIFSRTSPTSEALWLVCVDNCRVQVVQLMLSVCFLVAWRPSNMLICLREGSTQTIVCAATLRQNCWSNFLSCPVTVYTGPTDPSADPIAPGDWQGSHWSASF